MGDLVTASNQVANKARSVPTGPEIVPAMKPVASRTPRASRLKAIAVVFDETAKEVAPRTAPTAAPA
jgi:hypothetical protein